MIYVYVYIYIYTQIPLAQSTTKWYLNDTNLGTASVMLQEFIKGFDSAEDDRWCRLKLYFHSNFRQSERAKSGCWAVDQTFWNQPPTPPGILSLGTKQQQKQEEQGGIGGIDWIHQPLFMFELLVQGDREQTQIFINSWTTKNNGMSHKSYIVHKPQPAPSNPKQANMVRGSMQLTSTNRAMKSEPNGSDKEIVCVCVPDRKQDFLPICLNAWESLLCITMSLPQDCFLLDVLSDLSNTLHPIRIYMTCQAQYCSGSISPGFWPKLMNINLHPFR